MSGKPFTITPKEIEQGKIKYGKIESASDIGAAKASRAAVGYEGMPDSYLSCIPRAGSSYRDQNTCLYLVFPKDLGMFSTGLIPQYKYIKGNKAVPKTPENIVGYNMAVPLVKRDTMANPTEKEQQILSTFKAFHKSAVKYIMANREKLPLAFRSLSDEQLKKCVQTIETPGKEVNGTTYPATLFCKVRYFPEKPAEKEKKMQPEKFMTPFKGPGNVKIEPKTLVKTPGNVSFVLKINHLNFITGDSEKDMKIKFDTELAEVNFTKTVRQEINILGDNDDQVEEITLSKDAFEIDSTKSYGSAPTKYGDDESDSSVEEVKPKKKVVVEEKPKKKKHVVEEE